MLEGVDVSEFNASVPWAGIRPAFAVVRLTSGTRLDVSAGAHLANAEGAGVGLLAGYAWLRADKTGADQARVFLAFVDTLEAKHGPLALALDIEHRDESLPPWNLADYRREAVAFLEAMRAAGRVCAVYGPRILLSDLNLPAWCAGLPFWGASEPPAPRPWTSIAMQQTSVIGIDRDVFYGTADDWRRTFGLGPLSRADALARALAEVGTTESSVERIREYLSGCVRGGVPLSLPAGSDWCAAFVCWSGSVRPKRCAVWELVEDARAAGTLREVGAYWPSPGDLAVYGRAGESPLKKGERGHIDRVIKAQGLIVDGVAGNSGSNADSVAVMTRRLGDVLAWIEVQK